MDLASIIVGGSLALLGLSMWINGVLEALNECKSKDCEK